MEVTTISKIVILTIQIGWALAGYGHEKYPMEKGVHVLHKGERERNDVELYSETLMERGDSYGDDGDEYCYPPRGSPDQIKITVYEVKDEDKGNEGGLAFEARGGPGQNMVCFVLKSRYGKSYRYRVDIYGYRTNDVRMGNGNMGGPGTGFGSTGGNYGGMGSGYAGTGSGYGGPGNFGVGPNYGANGGFRGGNYGNQAGGLGGFPPYGAGNSGYGQSPPYGTGYGYNNPIHY